MLLGDYSGLKISATGTENLHCQVKANILHFLCAVVGTMKSVAAKKKIQSRESGTVIIHCMPIILEIGIIIYLGSEHGL